MDTQKARGLILGAPSQRASKHSLACLECSFILSQAKQRLICHFEHSHFILAQRIDWSNSQSLTNILDKSWSIPYIKLLKTASSSSQLELKL